MMIWNLAGTQMVVVGLKRKARNGTPFTIRSTNIARPARPNPAVGYAVKVGETKDGTVTGRLTSAKDLLITFNTKDKAVWPDA
jgi:type V secretory pathway adhesin AidA